MHVHKGFLVEERGRRAIGITRGDIGRFDATALCGGDQTGAGRVSRRQITDGERERARILGAYDRHSEVAPGAIQGIAQQQAMGRALSAFVGRALAEPELPNGPAFLDPSPRRFKPGPGKASKREDRLIKAEAKRQQSDYQRTVAEARRGLDMSNPRHVARFERRMASRTASADNSLNTALKLARECGETTGLIGR